MWGSSSAVKSKFSRVTMYCWIIWWCCGHRKEPWVRKPNASNLADHFPHGPPMLRRDKKQGEHLQRRFERAGRERSRGMNNDVKPNPVLTAFLWDPWCKARQEAADNFRGRPESQDTIHHSFLKSSLTREPRDQKTRPFSLKTKMHSKISRGLGALG